MRIAALIVTLVLAACAPATNDRVGTTAAELAEASRQTGEELTPGGVVTQLVNGRLVYEDDVRVVIFVDGPPASVVRTLGDEQELFPEQVNLGVTIDADGGKVNYRIRDGLLNYAFQTGDRASGASTPLAMTCTSSSTMEGTRTTCTRGGRAGPIIYRSSCTVHPDGSVTCRSQVY